MLHCNSQRWQAQGRLNHALEDTTPRQDAENFRKNKGPKNSHLRMTISLKFLYQGRRVCKRWFPNVFSSLVRRAHSCTPFESQFLPLFYLNFTFFNLFFLSFLAYQNRTIAVASDFCTDGAKSPEIAQKERVSGSEIAAPNRRSPATFHRTLKSQCSIALSSVSNSRDFWGPRWASQSQIAKIAAISVR